jgi:hypothetical protein
VRSRFGLTSALATANDYTQDWMVRLCALVNRQLALRLNLALTDDQITLVETAELEGYRSRNIVGCLLDRLQSLVLEKERGTTKLPIKNEIDSFGGSKIGTCGSLSMTSMQLIKAPPRSL